MRSVVHGFGWGIGHEIAHSVFGHGRSRKSRRLTRRTQRRVSARARASGIHQSWQALMRTIQVAEPRQMCWLPYTADMIRSALEFVGRECLPPSKFTRRHRPTRLAQAPCARRGRRATKTIEKRRCRA
jgi:hypothetical protein